LLLSPFPWQLGAGSLRMALTAPEIVVWWFFFFARVLPGIGYAIRHRFGDALPLFLFLSLLGVTYSLTFGNVGTAYRQRAQLMPYLLVLAGLRLESKLLSRTNGQALSESTGFVEPCQAIGISQASEALWSNGRGLLYPDHIPTAHLAQPWTP